jgi:hypothetical protein
MHLPVALRVPVALSAAFEVTWRSFGQMSWRAYCGDYQRTLLLTSGWYVPGAHDLALVMALYGLRHA